MTEFKGIILTVEVLCQGHRTNIELKFAVLANNVAPDDATHVVKRTRVVRDSSAGRGGKVHILRVDRKRELRKDVETLPDVRHDDRIAPGGLLIQCQVVDLFPSQDTLGTRLKREIERLQERQHRWAFFEMDARQVTRLDADVGN